MLSLRLGRRFRTYTTIPASITSTSKTKTTLTAKDIKKPLTLEEPALIKLKAERDPEKLFHLFKANANNRLVIENLVAFEDTVSRLAGAGRFDYIEQLLEHQKALPQGRREGFIMRIIMLYGKAGMVNHAIDTFKDALCRMGIPDKAYMVMGEMEKSGITPDVITYTTLISSFYKLNRAEIGNGLWNLMVMRGCLPNLATFNARVQFLVHKGRSWQANSLMGMMRYLGISPDEVTFNLVIKGFCRAGYIDMAKRVYSALHDEGYKPNARIYQTMMHYLCKEGEFDMAYTMCKNSMEKNWFPSIISICQLLQGLQATGKIEKARFILSLVHKKVPSFSSNQMEEETAYELAIIIQ
ncbi:unnamed protein product [Lactuca virosa]|uniref:Pentatricopeptide repeat-containing protein n=1 Tax=Lactuca virosa TaxID=75947 RepID=A0AAU9NN24_9ASTR|nr:unnamed protein product [Lactuca virosa]